MKAILQCGTTIDLGVDSVRSIRRAGKLYDKGIFQKIIIEEPVPSTYWECGNRIGGYGTLHMAGLIDRDERHNYIGPDDYSIDTVYIISADVEFTDTSGNLWKQGDVDEWIK